MGIDLCFGQRSRISAVALEECVQCSYITNSSNVDCVSLSSDEEMAGEESADLGSYSRAYSQGCGTAGPLANPGEGTPTLTDQGAPVASFAGYRSAHL